MTEQDSAQDIAIIYHSSTKPLILDAFGNDFRGEGVYKTSTLNFAFSRAGFVGRAIEQRKMALAKLLEHVSRDQSNTRVVAFNDKFPIGDYDGFSLTPYTLEEIRQGGATSFEERHPSNLKRIVYQPTEGDPIFGMFLAWKMQGEKETPLVLWIQSNRFLIFGN